MSGEQPKPNDTPGLAHAALDQADHETGKLGEATPPPVQNAAGAASDSAGSHVDNIMSVADGIADAARSARDAIAGK